MKKRSGSSGEYLLVPRLLFRANHANVPIDYTTRFWLTLHADSTLVPGSYSGSVQIDADHEDPSSLPITVNVLPIRLEPVPWVEYIFFPHPDGPLPTPNWEAVREGIDDVRYVYQLEKLCRQMSETHPDEVAMAERFLDEIRGMCDFDERGIIEEFGDWPPERFDPIRKKLVSMILRLRGLSP